MFKIEWDKGKVEGEILTGEGNISCLDFWVPVHIYADGNDLTGGSLTNMYSFYTALLNAFSAIDPEGLGNKLVRADPQGNKISEVGFTIYLYPNLVNDTLEIRYTHAHKEDCGVVEIGLKDFASETLQSAKELLEEIVPLDPECNEDAFYQALKEDFNVLRTWFNERYP